MYLYMYIYVPMYCLCVVVHLLNSCVFDDVADPREEEQTDSRSSFRLSPSLG